MPVAVRVLFSDGLFVDGGTTVEKQLALQMRGISKRFGSIQANKRVDLDVYREEILAILGENGCAPSFVIKTTPEACRPHFSQG